MKKILSLLMSIVMLLSITAGIDLSAYAGEKKLLLNNSWITDYITDSNKTVFYKFTIPSDGIVSISYMHYLSASCTFLDENLANSFGGVSQYSCSGSDNSPETTQFKYGLSKGTYYIKIQKYQSNGKFKIKGTFKSYENTEIEPNDFDNAMNIKMNTSVTGAITLQDSVDWYKFELKKKSKVRVSIKYYSDFDTTIYNSDLSKECWYLSSYNCNSSENSPKSHVFESVLNKGVYYIKIQEHFDSDTGKYIISVKENINIPSKFRVTSRNTNSLKLAWNKVSGVSGYQLQRKSGDSYKTLTSTKNTSYTVSKLSAGTTYKFRVRAYKTVSGKKYYSSWTYLTTPTKPSKPSIKTPSTNKKHQIIVKWKKVSKCSGYQVQYSKKKNFSSVIATKTVSGSSKTSYTGKNFTKGKTYYVRVRSYKTVNGTKYYSAWSSVKSIKSK